MCIIGAGKMSRLLVKHLQSKGCAAVMVLNRSLPRAAALAEEFPEVQFDIRLMPELLACVAASDVIFAASGSEELLVRKEDLMGAPARTPTGSPCVLPVPGWVWVFFMRACCLGCSLGLSPSMSIESSLSFSAPSLACIDREDVCRVLAYLGIKQVYVDPADVCSYAQAAAIMLVA